MRLLIVDDNVLDRKLIKNLIEFNTGIKSETAKDGFEALGKIKENNYDLVITDIVMPKLEGVELINKIRQLSPKTKIIAMSGRNPYYLYIVKKMGVNDVFTKPINKESFLDSIFKYVNFNNQLKIKNKIVT